MRGFRKTFSAVVTKIHYIAAVRMLTTYQKPFDGFCRYVFFSGTYPTDVKVHTPNDLHTVWLYSPHDFITLNEVFCRGDYASDRDARIIVDFGSNIGVTAVYYLTRNPNAFVYLFEADARNIKKLKRKLARFVGRYLITEAAVATEDGHTAFATESTGRYGGMLAAHDLNGEADRFKVTEVPSVDADRVLREIIAKHGQIDVLKVDIEGMEQAVLSHLSPVVRAGIHQIFVEMDGRKHPLPGFSHRQYGSVARYRRLALDTV